MICAAILLPNMNLSKKRVAVVGAGISGLACAYELQRAGCEVVVYEKDAHVGGRMSSRTHDGFIFDIGADHLCDLYDDIKTYCAEFGIPWEKMRFLKYGLLKHGKITAMDKAIGRLSKLRLALQFFLTKRAGHFLDLSNLAEFDTHNAYDHMRQVCGREVADYFVDPFTSTYQFHRATEISRGALTGIMRSIGQEPKRWELHRTPGGMQALPDAFAKRLNVRLNTPVEQVVAEKDVVVRNGDEEHFDAVILASTATVARSIYKNPTTEQARLLDGARYASSISLAFKVDCARMPEIAVVWVPFVENQKISGYVNESMKGQECSKDGTSLFCVWLHEDFAKRAMPLSDEEIFAQVKQEILKVCPWFTSADQLVNHDLHRWPEAMPKFYHGWLTRVRDFMQDGQGGQNVFFCGDYLNAPWTEGALRGGKRVAEQVLTKLRAS